MAACSTCLHLCQYVLIIQNQLILHRIEECIYFIKFIYLDRNCCGGKALFVPTSIYNCLLAGIKTTMVDKIAS